MGQAEEDDIHARRGLFGRELLEGKAREALEVGVGRGEGLADVVDGRHADELDVRVDEEAPNDLRGAVAAPADDRRLESLHGGCLALPRALWELRACGSARRRAAPG